MQAIRVIYESHPEAKSIKDIEKYIDELFSDEHSPITLSTVHRSKGLEADRIFIIKPEDLPLTWRNQLDWQLEQERNLLYVALTRSRSELYVVGNPSWLSFSEKLEEKREELAVKAETETSVSPLQLVQCLSFEQKCELLALLEKEVNREKTQRVKAALCGEMAACRIERSLCGSDL